MLSRRDMARALAVGVATPLLAACASQKGSHTSATTAADTALLMAALEGTKIPGMAAMVIRDFRAGPELVAGVRVMGAPDRVAPGDRWHLGSDGKAITGTMIARLVEKGVLSWDRPLAQMLPAFAPTMQAAYRDVTLPDLLSHRAGLPENISDMAFFGTFYDDPAPPTAQRRRYIDAALREAPVGPARAENSYSNTGLLIAGAIAEQATGRPFEELMAAEVFRPLGMRSVSFDQFGGRGEPSGHVSGRIANQPRDANPRLFAPAGGMRMTLQDWSKFCIDQLRGEYGHGKLLKQATYRLLHTGQGETASAFGWGVAPRPTSLAGPALTHAGSDGNWYALVILMPRIGAGVLVVANAGEDMGADAASLGVIRALAATVAEPATPFSPAPIP